MEQDRWIEFGEYDKLAIRVSDIVYFTYYSANSTQIVYKAGNNIKDLIVMASYEEVKRMIMDK